MLYGVCYIEKTATSQHRTF